MAVERERVPEYRATLVLLAENPLALRLKQPLGDQIGHRPTGLEGRVQRQPRRGPLLTARQLLADVLADARIAYVDERRREGLIVADQLAMHVEDVHAPPPSGRYSVWSPYR